MYKSSIFTCCIQIQNKINISLQCHFVDVFEKQLTLDLLISNDNLLNGTLSFVHIFILYLIDSLKLEYTIHLIDVFLFFRWL